MRATQKIITSFLKKRGWDTRAIPANYAKSISIEAAELLELFQWRDISTDELLKNKALLKSVKHELADIIIYCLDLASLLKIDPDKIVREKMLYNEKKYPVRAIREDPSNYEKIKKAFRGKRK